MLDKDVDTSLASAIDWAWRPSNTGRARYRTEWDRTYSGPTIVRRVSWEPYQ
jgi:hypothetical protein